MQQGLLIHPPCSRHTSLFNLLVGLLIAVFTSSAAFASSGGGGTNATNRATTGATVMCIPPVCTISGSTTICPGQSTMLCAPVGLASYLWSTGATTQCITVTQPGTYMVTVANAGGCTSTCNITLGTVSCSITGNTSICQGGSTQLCAIAGATSYSWSTGATTRCITVTNGGTYSVTVCINGCYLTCSVTVTVSNLNCSITGNNTICSGGSTQLCAPSGMASYHWSTGATTRCITVNAAGTYTVTVSNGGCTTSCSKTITANPPLNCTISGNTTICPGGSTTLCLPSGYASYSWNTGATTRCITVSAAGTYYGNVNDGTCNRTCNATVTVSSPNCSITGSSNICPGGSTQLCAPAGMASYHWSTGATTQCISVNGAGTYTVTVSNGACTTSCSKTVSVSNPSCTITGSSTVCNGNSTQLCAPAGMSSYSWSTGATTQCISVSSSGTYSVTTTSGGCSSSCNKTVTVNPPLNCAITGNLSFCQGGSTTLCLPQGYASYSWNTGATTRCITVSAPGTYYGNVNDGTCNTTCHVTVTQSNISCSISGSSTVCPGGSTQLCAPAGMSSYMWSTGATTQCINVNGPGTYTVTVSNNGCTSTCSKTVTQNNPSCFITGNPSVCQGGSTQLCGTQGMSSYLWSTGATTQCISVTSPGLYVLTVTNGNCTSTCSQNVTTVNPPPCTITGNCTICQGGFTQLCAPAGMSSYLWSTGQTTQCITVTTAGTYSVSVYDGGCYTNCSATVTVVNNIPCTITGNTMICQNGLTQLCAPVGMSSYLWSTGATTQCIDAGVGTYSVTVSNGTCSNTCSATVTPGNPVPCNITGNLSVCQGGTTQLCAPVGMDDYLWSTGATTQCINVGPGTYFVTVTNGDCSNTCSVTVTPGNPIPCSITGNLNICQGGSTQLCAPAGMSSYIWSTGATTQCITVNSAGSYSVFISNNGCSSSCSVNVTSGNVSCSITGTLSCCAGGTTQLCASPGMDSYLWSTGATTQCITAGPGTYSVIVTSGNCTSSCSTTITPMNPPPCTITGNTNLCIGGSTTLCAPAGMVSYLWNTGATTQCINVSSQGTYTVTVSNGVCSSTCSATVLFNNTLVCNITGNTTVCNGGTTQLCAPPGLTYFWSTGATTQCITVGPGTYMVTITNGNCTSSCSATVTNGNPVPCMITGNLNICQGGSTQLCAPVGMDSYAWSTGATTQCITVNSAGTYSVIVTNGGCTNSCSATVTTGTITCNITGGTIPCSGGTAQICAPAGMTSYLWSTGATTQCITVPAGTYSVSISNGTCTSSCSTTVAPSNPPVCDITGNLNICQGGSTQLCATAGMSSYLWSTGATTQCITVNSAGTYSVSISNGNCASSCSATVTVGNVSCNITGGTIPCGGGTTQICAPGGMSSYLWSTGATTSCITVGAGTYSVTISNGTCTSSCSTVVQSVNPPNCNITGNSFICPGGSSQLCASSGMASYLWSTGATTQCINVSSAATYSVIVTDANGCIGNCSKAVIVNTPPNCAITGNTSICGGGSTQLCAPAGLVSYLWSTGATTQCISVNSAATYTVIVTDVHGCTSSCSATVSVSSPQCTITGGSSLCNGPLSLCAPQGAQSYLWSTGATTQCLNVTTPGTYSVTTTYSGGCTASCSQIVTGGPTCNISGCPTFSPNMANQICVQTTGTYQWSNGATSQCISVNQPGTYTVTVTDPSGCVSTCSKTQTMQICYASPTNPDVTAEQQFTFNLSSNPQTVTIRTIFSKGFVDNTYGTNAIDWPNGHTFNNLVGSDHLQLALYDQQHVKKMEFKLDYISATNTAPSGYKSLGVTGGDGGMIVGNASDVVNAKTSLDANFNDYGYVLTTNSPATNANYTPNPQYPNWIYDVWYEVTVKLSAFPNGFGEPEITDIHASPSKTGHNTEIVVDTPCTPCISPLNLGDLVWFDSNRNGLKDQSENGLPNYTVKLFNDVNNDDAPDGPAIATTTTNNQGIYGFSGLMPGNYLVGVLLHSGDTMVTINGGDPDNNINNDNNGLDTINTIMYSHSVSLDYGTEPSNDGDGVDGNLTVDFAIWKSVPTNEKCYVGVSHTYVYATQQWTTNTTTNEATIRTTFSKNFVDNTYGTNAIGWPNGHTFSNLTGSDKLQLALYDVNGVKKLEFKIDYISSSNTFPSGYGTLGVTGGDGGMLVGNASSVHSTQTSLSKNFNDYGYVLTNNSPATNANYAVNPQYPNWIYDVWYEATVDLSLFPGGIINPVITGIHASPSKTGNNTEIVTDTICIYPRMAAANGAVPQFQSAEMYVNAYPNPFKGSTTIEFQRADKGTHVKIEVFNLAGNKVAEIFNQETEAGVTYKSEFNAANLSDGIYLYRVEMEDRVINGKLILMQ